MARRPLARHTPTLWNLAWARNVFWDGRARSLEEQVAGPIIAPDEMAPPMDRLIARLAADRDTARAFAKAFPKDPRVSEDNLKKAIATYERTFVSPQTRFDRWIEGDAAALSPQETEGFRLFTGNDKAFTPTRVRVRRGERLWFLNNDTRTHNIRVFDDKLDFDSGAQEPGETVEIAFPKTGSYLVFCGIHPKMELTVEVGR